MNNLTNKQGANISPYIHTRNLKELVDKVGNLYEAVAIVAKRANQISARTKEELHSKLAEFATTTDNLEEVFENREQIEISKHYERLPNPALTATEEFLNGKVYYRKPEEDTGV